jgi:hypothetical protein
MTTAPDRGSEPADASALASLRAIFDLLATVEDRWIRQTVPLAIGLIHRDAGLADFRPPADFRSDPIDSARHYAALSYGAAAHPDSDVDQIIGLGAAEADEHLRAGYLEAAALATANDASGRLRDLLERAEGSDPSPFVRQAAYRAAGYLARTLGTGGETTWSRILERGISDDSLGIGAEDVRTEVRRGAIEGIGIAFQGSASPWALSKLAPYIRDWSNYYLVAEAAFSIGMVALGTRDPEAMSLLRISLQHPEPHVRWNTGLAMGLVYFRSGDISLFDDCEIALADEDYAVRYYSSLGASLAFAGHEDRVAPYYRLIPERLNEYSGLELTLPNVDALMLTPLDDRRSYSGIGVHLQGYSSWYALPFYCTYFEQLSPALTRTTPADREVHHEIDCQDLLTLTVAHRFEFLRQRAGIGVYEMIADAYHGLHRAATATGGITRQHAQFWESLDSFTRVHARPHIAALSTSVDGFVASLTGSPVLQSMAPAAAAFAQPILVAAAGAGPEELADSLRAARAHTDSSALLGYGAAFEDVLQIWESATAIA